MLKFNLWFIVPLRTKVSKGKNKQRTVWLFLLMLNAHITISSTPRDLRKRTIIYIPQETCTRMFTEALFVIALN